LRPYFLGPANETIWSPIGHSLVGLGHVLFDGCMPPLVKAADMTGDSIVFIEAFNGCSGDADIDLFLNQLMGNTVVMQLNLNVVIDV
jgi:hypothetical protein